MKPQLNSYFSHHRRQSSSSNSSSSGIHSHPAVHSPLPPLSPSSSYTSNQHHHHHPHPHLQLPNQHQRLRGIQINISSDPFQHRIPPYLQRLWQESQWKQYMIKLRLLSRRYYSGKLIGCVTLMFSCICLVLLLHVGFFSGKKYQDWERQHHHHHQGSDEYTDEVDLLDNLYPDAGKGLTALIIVLPSPSTLSSSSSSSSSSLGSPLEHTLDMVSPLLSSLCKYDLFGEVLLWNNHPKVVQLSVDQLVQHQQQEQQECKNKITIHESATDLKASARYTACAMTKMPYCYFYDPPLQTQTFHLRSVYANFLRSPSLVHGESISKAHHTATQWTWCFQENNLSSSSSSPSLINTCYTPPGTGIFVTKDMTTSFIQQQQQEQNSPIDPAYADIYFTLWMNQGSAYLLQQDTAINQDNDINNNNDNNGKNDRAVQLTQVEMERIQHGLQVLYDKAKQHKGVTGKQSTYLENSKRDAKTACYDDRCLFLTNVASLPNSSLFSYDFSANLSVKDVIRVHDNYYNDQAGGAGTTLLAKHAYSQAVDGQDNTAWMSPEYIRKDDFIGLDLLMPMRIPLRYRFLVDHPYTFHRAIQLQISYDGNLWMDLRTPEMDCTSLDKLLECRFTLSETGYRFLRLLARHDLDYRFMVYDLSFHAKVKRDKNGQFLDNLQEGEMGFVED